MSNAKKTNLWLWLVLPAVLFLADPNTACKDYLPNFIGYALLLLGLYRISDLSDRIMDATERIKKMMWISVAALFVQYFLQTGLSNANGDVNRYESPTLLLLCSFVMLVLQWYFLLPAYGDLFCGLQALAERHGDASHLKTVRGKTAGERLATFSKVFVILSSLLSLLPELSVLGGLEYDVESLSVNWFAYIELFRKVSLLVSSVLSVIWLVCVARFTVGLLKDRKWCAQMECMYREEILTNTALLDLRRWKLICGFFAFGVLLTLDVQAESRDLLPAFLCVFFCIAGILLAGNRFQIFKTYRGLSGIMATLCCLCSVGTVWFETQYLEFYFDIQAALHSSGAYIDFLFLCGLRTLEALFTFLFLGCILRLLWKTAQTCLRVTYDGDDTSGISLRATQKLHQTFHKKIILTLILFALSAVGQAISAFVRLYFAGVWWITFALSAAAIFAFWSLLSSLSEEMNTQTSKIASHRSDISAHTVPVAPNDKKECMQNAEQSKQKSESEQPKSESEPEQSESESSE